MTYEDLGLLVGETLAGFRGGGSRSVSRVGLAGREVDAAVTGMMTGTIVRV